MEWATWLGSLSSLDKKGILTECIRQLDKQFDGTPVKALSTVVERQVMHEFCQLQCQPYIMDNYRRFVLIKEGGNDGECKDGVRVKQSDCVPLLTLDRRSKCRQIYRFRSRTAIITNRNLAFALCSLL